MDLLDSILKLQEKYDDDTPGMAQGGRIGFADGPPKRMYSGKMMTEEQIQAIRDRRKVPKKEGMVYDKETKTFRPRKDFQNIDRSIFTAPKSAETKAKKTTTKLKNFVEKFKLENNGQLPTQKEIMDSVGGKSSSIQKYLEEGVDYAPRLSKIEAGRLAGLKSGEVRAVPEGQDPSYVKRAKTLDEASKFLSKQDKADFKKINEGKKFINNYFKANPEAINTTEFGKNIKQLLSLRMDKDTGAIFSKVRPDEYYIKKAKEGKLFDIFDIKAVKEGGRSLRFPTNINITPGQFNQVFIQNQVGKYFAKGANPEALKNVEDILNKFKLRVKLPEVGYLGTDNPVAVKRATGEFPKITETLKSMKAPQIILDQFAGAKTNELRPLANIGCPNKKADGGRINFSNGQDLVACAIKGAKKLQNTNPKKLDGLAKSNIKTLTKTASGGRLLKNILGPGALAFEGLFAAPFAAYDYARGRRGEDIFKNALTLGLFDQKLTDAELKKIFPEYGQAKNLQNIGERLTSLERLQKGTRGQRIRSKPKFEKTIEQFETAAKPFLDTDDPEKAYFENIQKSQDALKELQRQYDERALQRKSQFDLSDPFMAAGGGIAKLAGVDSGPPPESGPNSQGLQGLMKRVRNR